jgi:NADH:ubiquinone oxidoreductase subunit 3 (subunit A)
MLIDKMDNLEIDRYRLAAILFVAFDFKLEFLYPRFTLWNS